MAEHLSEEQLAVDDGWLLAMRDERRGQTYEGDGRDDGLIQHKTPGGNLRFLRFRRYTRDARGRNR